MYDEDYFKILLGSVAVAGIGAGVAYTTQPDLKNQVNTLTPGTHKAGKTTVDDTKQMKNSPQQ
ncbi:Uncharacterised protein [Weissella viridescens]|uniref:Uncharacterized protein n=1 Tax=Weissella viridescens TaxID=1629 RepID=A0A380P6R0_WEIVI|nr:Uncharacterised protein [Weissella viridescens]